MDKREGEEIEGRSKQPKPVNYNLILMSSTQVAEGS